MVIKCFLEMKPNQRYNKIKFYKLIDVLCSVLSLLILCTWYLEQDNLDIFIKMDCYYKEILCISSVFPISDVQ